jgi:replicative DNA helicase
MVIEKTIPYDLDTEESVLGACLIDDEAILKIVDLVTPKDFYRDKNQWVMDAILSCFRRREAINQITIAVELKRVDKLDGLGGPAYLSKLIDTTPTAVHVEYYAKIVKKLSTMRSLIQTGISISDIGYECPEDEDAAVSMAVGKILEFTKLRSDGCVPISDITNESFTETMELLDGKRLMPGISTGFKRLDYAIGGWQKGMFTILTARPGVGKTATALASLSKCAKPDSKGVLFSLETPKRRIVSRMVYMKAGVNEIQLREDIRKNKLTMEQIDETRQKIIQAYQEVHDLPILIEDTGHMAVSQLEARIRRLQIEHEIGVVFIDHLGKLSDGMDHQRYQRISGISNKLSNMCLACDVPVVALAQLSRGTESGDRKDDKKPRMADLRDSGVIEEDARIILGLYRESYYNEQSLLPELMECIVLKNNEGESHQVVPLKYEKISRRIYDWPISEEYLLEQRNSVDNN